MRSSFEPIGLRQCEPSKRRKVMKVAACQMPDLRDPNLAIATVREYALRAQRLEARLVAFPEAFLQGYEISADHVAATAIDLGAAEFERLLRQLRDLAPVIVLGLIEKDARGFYNTAVVIERGRLAIKYRKRHLLEAEARVFDAGVDFPVLELDGVRVGISICYDLQFRDTSELAAKARARLLVCPCNNMLRRENAKKWKHLHNAVRAERAREAGVWILSSDVTGERGPRLAYGPTALIDPSGTVVDQVPLLTEGLLIAEVRRA
jgi:predicted amidohydrolase